jgi:hypothetical protein
MCRAKELAMVIIKDARSSIPVGDEGNDNEGQGKDDDDKSGEGSATTRTTLSGVSSIEVARKTYHLLRWLPPARDRQQIHRVWGRHGPHPQQPPPLQDHDPRAIGKLRLHPPPSPRVRQHISRDMINF